MVQVAFHVNSVFSSISYVVTENRNKDCWLIDVGDYLGIRLLLKEYVLKGVLLTHTHFDHIYGLNKLLEDFPAIDIYTNDFGSVALKEPSENLSLYHGTPFVLTAGSNVISIQNGDIIKFHDSAFLVHEMPGHDPSCICYEIEDALFTGDSYIPGMDVFTKFQNSNRKQALKSYNMLKSMSENYVIYPGHSVKG